MRIVYLCGVKNVNEKMEHERSVKTAVFERIGNALADGCFIIIIRFRLVFST